MRFLTIKNLNDSLNEDINRSYRMSDSKISEKGILMLNEDFMQDIGDFLVETLKDPKSLRGHYKEHVLKVDETRNSRNRNKYDFMSKLDYYSYAKSIANLTPTILIDDPEMSVDDASDKIDEYTNSTNSVLKIDAGLINKNDGHPMAAIFNKNSKYSQYMDLCLVDKVDGEPITIFPITGNKFRKYMVDFLGN